MGISITNVHSAAGVNTQGTSLSAGFTAQQQGLIGNFARQFGISDVQGLTRDLAALKAAHGGPDTAAAAGRLAGFLQGLFSRQGQNPVQQTGWHHHCGGGDVQPASWHRPGADGTQSGADAGGAQGSQGSQGSDGGQGSQGSQGAHHRHRHGHHHGHHGSKGAGDGAQGSQGSQAPGQGGTTPVSWHPGQDDSQQSNASLKSALTSLLKSLGLWNPTVERALNQTLQGVQPLQGQAASADGVQTVRAA
jgi:hypothetical protein